MTTRAPTLCRSCARYRGDGTCEAFASIPSSIIKFGTDHTVPVRGDGGVVYQMKNSDKAQGEFEQWAAVFGDHQER